jgi:hypothetical protein
VVAVGAISVVPLGRDVMARIAPELKNDAMAAVEPPPGDSDWAKQFRNEFPFEIRIGGRTGLFFRRNEQIEGLRLFVKHGFCVPARTAWPRAPKSIRGLAGKDECVALSRIGECSETGANASAFLLSADGLS